MTISNNFHPRRAAVFCLLLCVIVLTLFFYLYKSMKDEHSLYQKLFVMNSLAFEFQMSSDYLTREVRKYAVTGKSEHFDAYWEEVFRTKTRENAITKLKELKVDEKALQSFQLAKMNSDLLIETEDDAMKATAEGDLKRAQELVFGEKYTNQKSIISNHVQEYRSSFESQIKSNYDNKKYFSNMILACAALVIVLTILFISLMLYLYFFNKKNIEKLEALELKAKLIETS